MNIKLSSLLMSKIYSSCFPSLSFVLCWRVASYRIRVRVLVSSVGFILWVLLTYVGAVESSELRGFSLDRRPREVLTSSADVVSDLPLAKLVCSTPRNCSGRRQVVTALPSFVFHHVRVFHNSSAEPGGTPSHPTLRSSRSSRRSKL
jgi:hypothetical protein